MASRGRILWSTGHGAMCPECRRPRTQCACRKPGALPADGVVRVRRETKGRAGKGVTVVLGVPLAGEALAAFATELKKRCGSGGTVKDGTIEIQGDHRETVMTVLRARGWSVKAAGG